MSNKTCVECRYMLHKDTFEVCTHSMTNTSMFNEACKYFEPKVITNGDKIRQMSNAELARLDKCECCMYFGGRFCEGVFCEKPNGKTCTDGREAWLNAPAESEEKE